MLDVWINGMIALSVFNIGCAISQGWWSPNNTKLALMTPVWMVCAAGLIALLFIVTTFTVMPASLKAEIEKYPLDLG
ncbi:hypothetical protein HOU00_gp241 [Caulobacter phage CcrPW]|uniref:Uncharacterized protein n=1 Tax=Caulobacter phage CcrPW TaxID=2283271 RepID=A0A385EAJ8_9CAUD|nr:hypothetical protein HOU00_gp241 [Caulobacter phage CcrPW]AXQ68884.1 hypothetical protein CcrPW_gp345 [Caulobacter phage CcrPW]